MPASEFSEQQEWTCPCCGKTVMTSVQIVDYRGQKWTFPPSGWIFCGVTFVCSETCVQQQEVPCPSP